MNFTRTLLQTVFLAGLTVGIAVSASSAKDGGGDPMATAEESRELTFKELHGLYDNRSWIWKDGSGFFAVKKRRFTSWVGEKEQGSYGEGMWFFPGRGRVCFRAVWTAGDGSAEALTCFEHRVNNGVVYQRRRPDGDWYVFANRPVQAQDEVRKLKWGDYVARRFARNKRYLDRQ